MRDVFVTRRDFFESMMLALAATLSAVASMEKMIAVMPAVLV